MSKLQLTPFVAACVVLMLGVVLPAAAQSPSGPLSGTSTGVPAQASQEGPIETLKINVEVVQLFFNVKDKHGALIPALTKDDFSILEDRKPQTIKYFKAE